MNPNILAYVQVALPVVISIFGLIIHKAIKTPNDAQRAVAISKIAEGIAAIVIMQNPGASWTTLLNLVVTQLKIDPNATANINVATQAAAAALIAHGISPSK